MSRLPRVFPFLALAVAVYAIGVMALGLALAGEVFVVPMPSGVVLAATFGDLVLLLALLLFFVELIVATRPTGGALINHALSMALFIACLLLLLLVPAFGTAVFFFLTLLTLIDVVSGYSISIITARRDLTFEKSA